tara:strand:- start:3597 stop:4427 length:831 start_codon:yes stop_codon:yes gene_type:complete
MNDKQRKAMWANKKTPLQNQPSVSSEHFLNNPQTAEEARVLRLAKKYNAKTQQQGNMAYLAWVKSGYSGEPKFYLFNPEYKKLESEYNQTDFNDYEKRTKLRNKMDELERQYKKKKYEFDIERAKAGRQTANYDRFSRKNQRSVDIALNAKNANDVVYNNNPEYSSTKEKMLKGFNSELAPSEVRRAKHNERTKYFDEQKILMEKLSEQNDKIFAKYTPIRDDILKDTEDDSFNKRFDQMKKNRDAELNKATDEYNKEHQKIVKKYNMKEYENEIL